MEEESENESKVEILLEIHNIQHRYPFQPTKEVSIDTSYEELCVELRMMKEKVRRESCRDCGVYNKETFCRCFLCAEGRKRNMCQKCIHHFFYDSVLKNFLQQDLERCPCTTCKEKLG